MRQAVLVGPALFQSHPRKRAGSKLGYATTTFLPSTKLKKGVLYNLTPNLSRTQVPLNVWKILQGRAWFLGLFLEDFFFFNLFPPAHRCLLLVTMSPSHSQTPPDLLLPIQWWASEEADGSYLGDEVRILETG